MKAQSKEKKIKDIIEELYFITDIVGLLDIIEDAKTAYFNSKDFKECTEEYRHNAEEVLKLVTGLVYIA